MNEFKILFALFLYSYAERNFDFSLIDGVECVCGDKDSANT